MSRAYILTTQRTEFGRMIRKDYESHKVSLRRNDIRCWVPRADGISNTISTVTKDNILLVLE